MTQIYTRKQILDMVTDQIKILVAESIGQVEFFQANVILNNTGAHKKYPVIEFSYRGGFVNLMVYFHPVESLDIKNGVVINMGRADIYLTSEAQKIEDKIKAYLKQAVGDTIKNCIEENRPKG